MGDVEVTDLEAGELFQDTGRPDQSGRVARSHRGWVRTLRETPADWLMGRSNLPGRVLGWGMTAMVAVLPALGLVSLATILLVNLAVSKFPSAVLFTRMVGTACAEGDRTYRALSASGRGRPGITGQLRDRGATLVRAWDWTLWMRPQMRQQPSIGSKPEVPLEVQLDPSAEWTLRAPQWVASVGVRFRSVAPAPLVVLADAVVHSRAVRGIVAVASWWADHSARGVIRFEHWLYDRAENGVATSRRRRPGTWMAGQVDDWLNGRSGAQGTFIAVTLLVLGQLAHVTTAGLLINGVVSWVPATLAVLMMARTGDVQRFTREGTRQRPSTVMRVERRRQELEQLITGAPAHVLPQPAGLSESTRIIGIASIAVVEPVAPCSELLPSPTPVSVSVRRPSVVLDL